MRRFVCGFVLVFALVAMNMAPASARTATNKEAYLVKDDIVIIFHDRDAFPIGKKFTDAGWQVLLGYETKSVPHPERFSGDGVYCQFKSDGRYIRASCDVDHVFTDVGTTSVKITRIYDSADYLVRDIPNLYAVTRSVYEHTR